jgi:glycerol kinase
MLEPEGSVIVAIDQGTSSTKVIVVDAAGAVVSQSTAALGQTHPQPGWVEQDANELFASVTEALAVVGDREVAAIGISSQRESAVIWDRSTGEPLGPVLGWQDRRTIGRATELADRAEFIRERSGLPLDPMFSALKFEWLLDSVGRERADIAIGTVDSWIVFKLTGEHRIEVGNASRTQLLNIETADWDDDLLALFNIPRDVLPVVVSSDAPSAPVPRIGGARIHAVLGDSHAALYGHGARSAGQVKVTYGTGSSVMGIGDGVGSGLVRTIAWSRDVLTRAFEGNILSTGATLVWLAGVLDTTPSELFDLAESANPDHGISFVPAFAGLGAPWWDDTAQAVVTGFDLGSSRADLARAAAESIAFQVDDVLSAADEQTGSRIDTILADGGPSANGWLMQLQADVSGRRVIRSTVAELSAFGAAAFAGVGAGFWTDESSAFLCGESTPIEPAHPVSHDRWNAAVARSRQGVAS